ncbi:MAG: hypothetical protein MJ234_01005 [bacterium]|nr:hypothetical protein [bacterium]
MRKNPKKVITSCQFKVVRSECPAIKNVRSVRNRLNKLVLEQADPELIEKMRTALKNAKTGEAKKNQCAHCHHAEKANA